MKIDTRNITPRATASRPRALSSAVFGLGALLLSSSCVTQARYDEAMEEVKFYQRNYQDLESFQGQLERNNEQLRRELELFEEGGTIESTYSQDIDARMQELERIASGIGGAPGDVTVLAVEGGYGLRLADAVLFESGSDQIRSEGRELLLRMAKEIASRPYQRIWVRGHTDSDPVKKPQTKQRFPHGNLQLSTARAIEVAALLGKEGGIMATKVVVAGFGSNEPVVKNDSAANKQLNRRVEIFVIEDESAGGGR